MLLVVSESLYAEDVLKKRTSLPGCLISFCEITLAKGLHGHPGKGL